MKNRNDTGSLKHESQRVLARRHDDDLIQQYYYFANGQKTVVLNY